jgi:hypothetical protein
MQTVVETPSYLKAAGKILSEDEHKAIVAMVSASPECGDLIRGTGAERESFTFSANEYFPIFLVAAYPKNEKENLTKAELNELARIADVIFTK